MEVILNQTIDNLGLEGDVVKVKPGYARNYLLPQQKAVPVTKENLARLQHQKEAIASRLEKEKQEAEALSAKLAGTTIEIARRVGEEDRLFGSVTAADITAEIEKLGTVLDKRAIALSEPIKSLGENKVTIKVGYQLTTEILVNVVPDEESEE